MADLSLPPAPTTDPVTPLAARLAERIRADGPMPVDVWMEAVLTDPVHGYYATRDPFGVAGDFVTAPEVSQVFGELIGLWAAAVWDLQGRPRPLRLVELGPGRGTLMADALRAVARAMPALAAAADLHLVESSPVLRERQRDTIGAVDRSRPITWHEDLKTVPRGALLAIANELFDALPIRQLIRTADGWDERRVDLCDDGAFEFVATTLGQPPPELPDVLVAPVAPGGIVEVCPAGQALAAALARRIAQSGGAALILDYGHVRSAAGETLQAVRRHAPAHPLDRPGETDLTAHVDFQSLASAVARAGAQAWGPLTQGTLLGRLGIEARIARLAAAAPPRQQNALLTGWHRLVSPQGMGVLFKALAITAPGAPPPPGFDEPNFTE